MDSLYIAICLVGLCFLLIFVFLDKKKEALITAIITVLLNIANWCFDISPLIRSGTDAGITPSPEVLTTETPTEASPAPSTEAPTEAPAFSYPSDATEPITEETNTQTNEKCNTIGNTYFRSWVKNKDAITSIYCLNTFNTAPNDAIDISENGDRSVLGWINGTALYIATDGILYLPEKCNTMFLGFTSLLYIDTSNWDMSKVKNVNSMFYDCKKLESIDSIQNWNTSSFTSTKSMFYNCSNLSRLNINGWNVSQVHSMWGMFFGCSSLTSLDLNNWNTSNVTGMRKMFAMCTNLESLEVSNWDTSKVEDMRNMYYYCIKLSSLDMSRWDISNLQKRNGMFKKTKWENNPPYPFS